MRADDTKLTSGSVLAQSVRLKHIVRHGFNRHHLVNYRFWRNILFVRPGNSTKKNTDLIEIMHISEFPEDTAIKVRLHIKNTLTTIFNFHINAIIR
ncbi:hypothetical protein CferDRAFT_1179 [Chlorobium ferrooxidans DSM 13031]|uniref:Uncharacterized protein n=1 Tax=Chlorobium ferrooxidans DSM 13031 TaxID=377431 RepID=Q0YS95_9CHLB|nr:hypothetical protein CferDRAFT_1179 [Chlorobium ferrooxidans DSM 13031]